MIYFDDEQVRKIKKDLGNWLDNGIVEQVAVIERLLQTDDLNNSVLCDIAMDYLEIMHDEAVRRLAVRCGSGE